MPPAKKQKTGAAKPAGKRAAAKADGLEQPLSAAELEDFFTSAGKARTLKPGDTLITHGQKSSSLYLVLDGALTFKRRDGSPLGASTNLGAGGLCGELSFLTGSLPNVTALAAKSGALRVAELPHSKLLHLLEEQPALATRLFIGLAGRLSNKV